MERFFTPRARLKLKAAFFTLVFALAACANPFGGEEPQQYTITFDSQGGSEVAAITMDQGTAVPRPPDPLREGYAFLGWHTSGGEPYTWPHALTADVTMHARWEPALDADTQQAVEGFNNNAAVKEALAQDAGDIGLDAAKAELAALSAKVEEALAAYRDLSEKAREALAQEKARLEAIKEKIANVNAAQDFQRRHGAILSKTAEAVSLSDEEAVDAALQDYAALGGVAKTLLTAEYERLSGFKQKIESLKPVPAITYTAAANGSADTVSSTEIALVFSAAVSGLTADDISLADGAGAASKGALAGNGQNWTLGVTVAAAGTVTVSINKAGIEGAEKTVTLRKAAEAPPAATIVFDSRGGSALDPVTEAPGTEVPEPAAPTRTGYLFEGWHTSGGEPCAWPHALTADVIMHARWSPAAYTVAYNGNGGSGTVEPTSHVYDAEQNLAANSFARTGYVFAGWSARADGGGASYNEGAGVTNLSSLNGAVVTLYARWTPVAYTVAYNGNGGSGAVEPASHAYDAEQNLAANSFSRTGYAFAGWNTRADGGGTSYNEGAGVKNLSSVNGAAVTMYAIWTPITYTVAYNGNGGSGAMAPASHAYDAEQNLAANSFVRTGFAFTGWNTRADGGGAGYAEGQSVSNLTSVQGAAITFYAQWTPLLSVNIAVWANEDGSILVSNNDIALSKSGAGGAPVAFTAQVTEAYAGIQWELNGFAIAGNTEREYAISAASYPRGSYVLGLRVSKDGIPYSTDIRFEVTD
jgi:uncharacterized repeat protein (TIGR02543 family)